MPVWPVRAWGQGNRIREQREALIKRGLLHEEPEATEMDWDAVSENDVYKFPVNRCSEESDDIF
jgi:hypothetical protein